MNSSRCNYYYRLHPTGEETEAQGNYVTHVRSAGGRDRARIPTQAVWLQCLHTATMCLQKGETLVDPLLEETIDVRKY